MKRQEGPIGRIFVCVNEKSPEKPQCLKGEGERIAVWLKDEVQRRGLKSKIWITRTKCQGYCEPQGTVLTIQPTNEQYSEVILEDAKAILEKLIQKLAL